MLTLQGVAVHKDLQYLIVETERGDVLVILEDRHVPMQAILGDLRVLGRISGKPRLWRS
jgi:hypothetical protein